MTKEFVLQVLKNNGIDQEYLNINKGIMLNEKWLNVCEELVGNEVYDDYFDTKTN